MPPTPQNRRSRGQARQARPRRDHPGPHTRGPQIGCQLRLGHRPVLPHRLEIERFFAAASAIWCLPQGRVAPDPEPVRTRIRPAAMLDLGRQAGYADGQILPIEHPVWRFCGLVS